jgi:hypothetical protein
MHSSIEFEKLDLRMSRGQCVKRHTNKLNIDDVAMWSGI